MATNDCTRDTVRGGAGAYGRATPLDGRRLLSPHGRAALRDTTVPDSTWHGVSGRGASAAWLPKPLAQPRPGTPPQKLVRHSALLQTRVSDPSGRGRTRHHGPFFCALPYFFGMVLNSGPSHKCVSEAQAVGERIGQSSPCALSALPQL
jgi:hypothetical protein